MTKKEEIKKIIECLELITKRIKKIEKDVLRLHKQKRSTEEANLQFYKDAAKQYKDQLEEKRIDEGGWRS
mgnify:CR=1 FL=1|jgi:proline dehydrogenase